MQWYTSGTSLHLVTVVIFCNNKILSIKWPSNDWIESQDNKKIVSRCSTVLLIATWLADCGKHEVLLAKRVTALLEYFNLFMENPVSNLGVKLFIVLNCIRLYSILEWANLFAANAGMAAS